VLLPQIAQARPALTEERFKKGLLQIMTGLFMKVILADNMAWLANHAFTTSGNPLTGPEVLLGVYAFALQIYGDFAGYSAIACGCATWMGFDLMDNFRRPYFASNPRSFWARWHISLSTWLRDYLYIPLGGNRKGSTRTAINLFLTMLLGGLWHGAAWTFVVWGALHGGWLVADRWISGKDTRPRPLALRLVLWLVTFHIVCLTWLLFRAESMSQAWTMLQALPSGWHWTPYAATTGALILFFGGPWMAYEAWVEGGGDDWALLKVHWLWRACFYALLVFYLLFFLPPATSEFIYFQF
jgi:D-alanyl-lipoteichoic acid acyltransferase DltB (MBOAT superfamily)